MFTHTCLTSIQVLRYLLALAKQVGYAGENFPRSIFPSMVGRPILRAEEAISEAVVLKEIMVSGAPTLSCPPRDTALSIIGQPHQARLLAEKCSWLFHYAHMLLRLK